MCSRTYIRPMILFGLLSMAMVVHAQFNNLLFGIHNPQVGVYHFCSIDRSSGVITDLEQIPISTYGGLSSLSVDPDLQRVVFNSATEVYILDPTGGTPYDLMVPPLPPGSFLGPLERDPCSGSFYGFLLNNGITMFVAYDLALNSLTILSEIIGLNGFSGMSYIDPVDRTFVIEHANTVMVIDFQDGSVLSNLPLTTPPGYSFRGIGFDCISRRTFGTLASGLSESQKWLGELDRATGVVSFVSAQATNLGYFKPSSAGACIVQDEGLYIWEGNGGVYVGASIIDGVFSPPMFASSPAPVLDIVHYSTCACPLTNVQNERSIKDDLGPYPNPSTGTVNLKLSERDFAKLEVQWVDPLGRTVLIPLHTTGSNLLRWDLSAFAGGIYALTVTGQEYRRTWRVVHQ